MANSWIPVNRVKRVPHLIHLGGGSIAEGCSKHRSRLECEFARHSLRMSRGCDYQRHEPGSKIKIGRRFSRRAHRGNDITTSSSPRHTLARPALDVPEAGGRGVPAHRTLRILFPPRLCSGRAPSDQAGLGYEGTTALPCRSPGPCGACCRRCSRCRTRRSTSPPIRRTSSCTWQSGEPGRPSPRPSCPCRSSGTS